MLMCLFYRITFVVAFYLEIAIMIVTFLLLTVLASPAVNQYLTGKVREEHLTEQRELLVKDVYDCSERPKVSSIDISLIENIKRLYHCLRGRVHHCDGRRRESLKSAQLAQDKNRIYCNNIIYKGAYTTHEEQTFHVQMWSNFIVHIDCLLFDFEWYNQVYHGMSISEYIRDGGRNTTYYTGRRLPWSMITTSNTAEITISTFAYMKFELHLLYSSTKWSWYPNIKSVYSAMLSNLTYPLDLVTTLQMSNRIFKAFTYHFIQADYKQVNIIIDSIVNSVARIVIYDGPGSRSPRLWTIDHHDSTGNRNIKTTAFHAYIEVYIFKFEAKEQWHILLSQLDYSHYPECPEYHIVFKYSNDWANTICYVRWSKFALGVADYLPFIIEEYRFYEGALTAMTGYVTPKCQHGGLYYLPSPNKALCKTTRKMLLDNDGSVESILIVWFSGYSRGSVRLRIYKEGSCRTYSLDNHLIEDNKILLIDTIEYCRKYVCPESMNPSQNLLCNFELNIPSRPVGSTKISISLTKSIDDCVPGPGKNNADSSFTVSTSDYTHSRFGYNKEKRVSKTIKEALRTRKHKSFMFRHTFQYLVSANVSLPRVCFQELSIRESRMYMVVMIATCGFYDDFSATVSYPLNNIYSLDNCLNYTTRMKPPSILINHENYTSNYSRHHIITSYPDYCPHKCRTHSFHLKIYRKFDDRVDEYSGKIGESVSTKLNYDSFWMQINRPVAPCAQKCMVFVKISDEDELSGTDLKQAAVRRYRFHDVGYV